jgi:hypothetical protein
MRPVHELRHAHYLRRGNPVGWPAISVAVSVVCTSQEETDKQRIRQTRLSTWSATTWIGKGSPGCNVACGSGMDAAGFWKWLAEATQKGGSVWVWQMGASHGLTMLGFWKLLELGLWSLDGYDPMNGGRMDSGERQPFRGLCVIQDAPTVIMARPVLARGMYRFVDVRNLGVDGWPDIAGDVANIPHMLDRENATPAGLSILATWRAEQLALWLREWYHAIDEMELGGLRHTASAQSWHGWKCKHLQGPLLVHANEQAIRIERDSIHSGRCECFTLGKVGDRVYQVDASAFYPSLAEDYRLPVRLVWNGSCSTQLARKYTQDGLCVIARGFVGCERPIVPITRGQLTLFPVGEFEATLCWPEWQALLDRGASVDITEAALYEPGRPVQRFMRHLWGFRERYAANGRKARVACVKRMANSLIGKFAAWDMGWKDEPTIGIGLPFATWPRINASTHQLERWRAIAWHTQREVCNGESQDSMPAIASWVYSLARSILLRWIEAAGWKNVHYVDTDSLWLTEEGFRILQGARVIGEGGRGMLRLVRVHDWVEFLGIKYYATPLGITCAGITDNYGIATGGGFEFWTPEKMSDSLRRKEPPGERLLGYRIPEDRKYRHGIVGNDGRVSPHRIGREP